MRSIIILGMCSLFLIQYFAQLEWLGYAVVVLSLLAFLGSAGKADRFPRILGIIMMGTGLIVELSKGTGFQGISEGIFMILPLISLITLAPLLSIPLKLGGYFQSVSRLLYHVLNQPKKLFAGITGTLFVISPVLNLGSVRIIHDFLDDLKLPSHITAKGYVVGFATAPLWSPYFASVSLVLFYLDLSFKEYMLYGMGLSLLSLLIGNFLFVLYDKRHPMVKRNTSMEGIEKETRQHMLKLVLFVVILMITCLVIESVTHWSMVVIVCLVSIMVPLINGLVTTNWKGMAPLWKDYRSRTVPMMNNEITLFMSAGMLAFALKGTTVMNGISSILVSIADRSFILFAVSIMLIVLVVTYIGIHQIAAVGALAMQLGTVNLGISDVSLAMILLLSWSVSTAMSPFSGLNLMVARFAQMSGVKVGLRTNGVHLLFVTFISIAIISLIQLL